MSKEVASWFDKTHSFEPLVKSAVIMVFTNFLAPIYFNGELITFVLFWIYIDDSPHS